MAESTAGDPVKEWAVFDTESNDAGQTSTADVASQGQRRRKQRSGLTEMLAANSALTALNTHPAVRVLPGGKLCSPPSQRQMWGDTQILPHINWADLFFDLFYVAAAFNLAGIYKYSLNGTSILYFLGCFGPVMLNWVDKTHYNSRFEVPNDAIHRFLEIFELCALSLTTLHIAPVYRMSNVLDYSDMLFFSFGLVLCNVFILIRYIEIGFVWVDGGPEARINGRNLFLTKLIPTSLFASAAVVTWIYQQQGIKYTHVPITLCLCGWIVQDVIILYKFLSYLPDDGSHKDKVVPMNVHYMIHRYGEWTMLVLGESILSLITADIPPQSDPKFYISFFSGILSVVLLQYLHYKSQPQHAKEHALCSHKVQGIMFLMLTQFYSAALVLVGASYKLLMKEHLVRVTQSEMNDLRFLIEHIEGNVINESAYDYKSRLSRYLSNRGTYRRLANYEDSDALDHSTSETMQENISTIFCLSLASSWFFLDLIILTHRGLSMSLQRLSSKEGKSRSWPVLFIIMRLLLIVSIITFGFYFSDPDVVSVVGLIGIVAQVILRKIGKMIFFDGADNTSFSINLQQLQQDEIPTLG